MFISTLTRLCCTCNWRHLYNRQSPVPTVEFNILYKTSILIFCFPEAVDLGSIYVLYMERLSMFVKHTTWV